jgi:hypothetical protein
MKEVMLKLAIVVMVFANILDYVTTVVGIKMGFREMNVIVASLTPLSFMILKILIISFVLVVAIMLYKLSERSRLANGAYYGLIVGIQISSLTITVVGLHNLMLMLNVIGSEQSRILLSVLSSLSPFIAS